MADPKKKRPEKDAVPKRTELRNREEAIAEAEAVGANPNTAKMRKSPRKEPKRQALKKEIGQAPNSRDKKPKSKKVKHTRKELKNHPLSKLDRSHLAVPPLPDKLSKIRMGHLTPEESRLMAKWWKVEPDHRANVEMCSEITKHVSNGNFLVDAAALCGVSERMFVAWRAEGHDMETAGHTDTLAAIFFRDLRVAEAQAKNRAVVGIQAHGKKSFQALAWFLKMRFKEQFSDRLQVETENLTDGDVGPDTLPDEDVEDILRRMYGDNSEAA